MAGIIHLEDHKAGPAPEIERELTVEGSSVRVARLSEDTVTLAIERSTGAGDACLAAALTRNQASALIKMLLEVAS